MSAARHTPGPWRVGSGYWICKGKRAVMEVAGNVTDAERQSIVDSLNRDYAEESIVPDLLAACIQAESVLRVFRECSVLKAGAPDTEAKLRAAILKAEGGGK